MQENIQCEIVGRFYVITQGIMLFVNEELVDREIEIASYLLQSLSLKQIGGKTGLSKKHIVAHVRNMQEKLGPDNTFILKKIFKIHT